MSSIAFIFFFFNDTATTEIYTLSLHDALPISYLLWSWALAHLAAARVAIFTNLQPLATALLGQRSEEHTSELQSLAYLVCRLLLEKKKNHDRNHSFRYIMSQQLTPSTEYDTLY